jgi:hypothetical protein
MGRTVLSYRLASERVRRNGTYLGKDWTSPEYFVNLLNSTD